MKSQKQTYWNFDDYSNSIIVSVKYSRILLLEFAKHSKSVKDKVIYNFIAKATGLLESILILWQQKHFSECWILFRSLIDRIIHLWYLNKHDDFELFHNWTFIQKFEANNKVKSDPLFNKRIDNKHFTPSNKDKKNIKN